jgi:hypothetical protein
MTTNMFYQIWDIRGETPRVLAGTRSREEARASRRTILAKNPKLTSQDVRLVQMTADTDSGNFRFIR